MEKTLNTPARAMSRRSLVAFGLTALFAGTLAGCGAKPVDTAGSTPAKAVGLQIFAANSLEKAMPEVQALYTEKTGVTFADTQFKASGDLIEQMRAGAPPAPRARPAPRPRRQARRYRRVHSRQGRRAADLCSHFPREGHARGPGPLHREDRCDLRRHPVQGIWRSHRADACRRPGRRPDHRFQGHHKAVELQIFAAISLEKAMPEVQALYTEKTGVTFADTQFKASGDLIEQMRAGAQADALITASKGTMDDAVVGELVDEATRLWRSHRADACRRPGRRPDHRFQGHHG